ncbi:hypothetical protein [Pseudomonas huaxiensis]|uniref:hypothetical protein n=1 Tax=Pseudomonas huaxiensis TaxID=2213017 RepID=UPI001300A217|nr:hypothetical protein [Pseudomonas huaxiensis]
MNEKQRLECSQISDMSSEQAAEWIMNRYPLHSSDYGEAFILIPHRSWSRSEQRKLANYYLRKIPFAGGRSYESLASIMPARVLLVEVYKYLPDNKLDLELLIYYLTPALLKCARADQDVQAVEDFLREVGNRLGEK